MSPSGVAVTSAPRESVFQAIPAMIARSRERVASSILLSVDRRWRCTLRTCNPDKPAPAHSILVSGASGSKKALRKSSQSSAESKPRTICHLRNGSLWAIPGGSVDDGIIKYQPTRARAATWRNFNDNPNGATDLLLIAMIVSLHESQALHSSVLFS